jgi:hypothetical protein
MTETREKGAMDLKIEDGLCWSAPLKLTTWSGYQSRYGHYGAVDSATPSDGRVKLVFAPEGRETEPLTPAELGLISWFEAHEPAVSEAVKAAILAWCAPDNPERLREFDFPDGFPAVKTQEDLLQLIGLHTVFIHQLEADGTPYIGYEFGCEWEVEHDLGVLMHGTRPVKVGFADAASLLWMAEEDWERRANQH